MHPHLLFPEYEYSVYVDANIWIISDMTPVAAGLDRYPIAMFRHKKRDCAYDEVQACIDQKKADPASLRLHEKLLYAHGVPPKWGLLEASETRRSSMRRIDGGLVERVPREFAKGSDIPDRRAMAVKNPA